MPLFAKKKEEEPTAAPAEAPVTTPVDLVLQMRQQGFTNNQVVQALQREGYKSHQIFDALNQADLRSQPTPPTAPAPPPPPEEPAPPAGAPPPPPSIPQAPMASPSIDRERIEEVTESIVDEKWELFEKDVKKIIDWKDKTEAKINQITQQINDLKESFDGLRSGVLGKISEYDKSITNVGTEIKALEKVFQKVLPTLTENVSELSRITRQMRGKTSK
jgi:hypothetical protein